ncbi:hypothetical protein VTN00DRAFT_2415 [Thermoascus crustaceus]|uniref:uncharacterized protein n=1 Tax=Thermoascus crustaceus TaxID=5088 RepID=UPI00374462FC
MPGATIEAEYCRWIAAINAVIAFCDVEEGAPLRPIQSRKRPATDAVTSTHAKRQECSQEGADVVALHQAIASVRIGSPGQRPMICFLCVGNPGLPMEKRTREYSLTCEEIELGTEYWLKRDPTWLYNPQKLQGSQKKGSTIMITVGSLEESQKLLINGIHFEGSRYCTEQY